MLHIVNMIPNSLSGEHNQDSEPNIAVNPQNTNQIAATAFTAAPMGGVNAPIYVSTDGGATWTLNTIVPGNGFAGTFDITIAFSPGGGTLYAGTINSSTVALNILRTANYSSSTTMTTLVTRSNEDQPWVVAAGSGQDRVFVGNNDFNQPSGQTATVDLSQNAATAPAPAGFSTVGIEKGTTTGQDGPPVRMAVHTDGTVYAALQRWTGGTFPNVTTDIVVVRDDSWGASTTPFSALVDSSSHIVGQRAATSRTIAWNALMGQERIGADIAIAVDPNNSSAVWLAWCDRVGGVSGTDWTVHVSRSTDKGQTWSADLRTITNVKNPALAVNSAGLVGFLYQQFSGTTWDTKLELTTDGWATAVTPQVLQTVTSTTPAPTFQPYIGDYVRLVSVGTSFYGVFCGNNTPNMANFPNGVTYQRNANWTTHTLLNTDGATPVAASIDPFFFHWSELVLPRGVITRGPIVPSPIHPRPRGPIARGPIFPAPPQPPEPIIGPGGPLHEDVEL
jgi:hypothetical protein